MQFLIKTAREINPSTYYILDSIKGIIEEGILITQEMIDTIESNIRVKDKNTTNEQLINHIREAFIT